MAVNRFMSPLGVQHQQTYVSQYIPEPIEQMQALADRREKQYQSVKDNWAVLKDKFGEHLMEADNPMLKTRIGQLETTVNEELEKYNGDWSQMTNTVNNMASSYKRWSMEELGKGRENKASFDKQKETITKSNIPDYKKEAYVSYMNDKYTADGGWFKPGLIELAHPYDISEATDKLLATAKAMTGDKTSKDKLNVNYQDGKFILTGYEDDEFLDWESRLKPSLTQILLADDQFKSMVNQDYKVKSFYDPDFAENTTYAEFAKQEAESVLSGYEGLAYDRKTTRSDVKESYDYKKSADKLQTKSNVPISFTWRVNTPAFDYTKLVTEESDNAKLIPKFQKTVNDKFGAIGNTVVSIMKAGNITGEAETKFNQKLKALGYDLSSPAQARTFTEGVANGTISLEDLVGRQEVPKLRQQADNILKTTRNDEQVLWGIVEDLGQGNVAGLTPDKARRFLKFTNETFAERQALQAKAGAGELKPEEEEELAILSTISDRLRLGMGMLPLGEQQEEEKPFITPSGVEVTKEQLDSLLNQSLGDYDLDINVLSNVKSALSSTEAGKMMRNRLTNAKDNYVNYEFTSDLALNDNMSEREKLLYITEVNNAIDSFRPNIEEVTVMENGNYTNMSLRKAVEKDVMASMPDGYTEEDLTKATDNRLDDIFDSDVTFGDLFDPVTGNLIIGLGKYVIDMGTDPESFNIPGMMDKLDRRSLAISTGKTNIVKALKSGARDYTLEQGVNIHTPQPLDVDTIDENYEQIFKSGDKFMIRLNNDMFGIDDDSMFTVLRGDDATEFASVVSAITIAYNKKPVNNGMTKREAIKDLANAYKFNPAVYNELKKSYIGYAD